MTRIFRPWSGKPLGRLLAEGIALASARELANASNWRLRAVIPVVRSLRDQRCTVEIRCLARRDELGLRRYRARLGRAEWALRELLKQRARLRRDRGRQTTMDFETIEPDDPNHPRERALAAAELATEADNPRHSSESFEHGTPPEIVEAARVVLGSFDLDPASCDKANGYVRAVEYMTREDNGFVQAWWGNVFLNPPGGLMELDTGRPVFIKTKKRAACTVTGACGLPPGHVHKNVGSSSGAWWKKLAREYSEMRIRAGIFIGFSLEILQTTQADPQGLPLPLDFPICYPRKRLDYIALEREGIVAGGAPTHASFIALLPPYGAKHAPDAKIRHAAVVRFRDAFSEFGKVVG